MHFIKTVLPLPLAPIMRLHLPACMVTLTPFNTVFSPNPFFMLFTSIMVYEFTAMDSLFIAG
jgi:hypothetical protein